MKSLVNGPYIILSPSFSSRSKFVLVDRVYIEADVTSRIDVVNSRDMTSVSALAEMPLDLRQFGSSRDNPPRRTAIFTVVSGIF
jgi:hypothetical protein